MKKNELIFSHTSESEQDTRVAGLQLAEKLKPGDSVYFFGNLGCGKTIMVKAIAEGFDVQPEMVNSPTFVLMNVYRGLRNNLPLHIRHFDFYRLSSLKEIDEIGFWEYRDDYDSVCLIEWAERLGDALNVPRWEARFTVRQGEARKIDIMYISDEEKL